MAQIRKGTTFSTGDQVTAVNLNAHVDSAILLPGAVNDQPTGTANSGDYVLAVDSSLKKLTVAQLQAGGVKTDGSVAMTGELQLSSSSPSAALKAASKGYVDSVAASVNSNADNRISRSGDTMSGPLYLAGDAGSALQAVTKQQFDGGIQYAINQAKASQSIVAWVHFNGIRNTAGAIAQNNQDRLIVAGLNVGSVNRVNAGEYTVNFASPLVDGNYAISLSASYGNTLGGLAAITTFPNMAANGVYISPTNTQFRVLTVQANVGNIDCQNVYVQIVR
jgi:hypothetical protein